MRNASTVTLIVGQGNQGSDAAEDEASDHERIVSVNAASGIRAKAGATEAALTKFLVHENVICEASPVLKAAFQGNFAEAGNKTMTIKDLDVDMVDQFVKWLYRGKVLPVKPETKQAEQLCYLNMAHLVVVANMWLVEDLEDDVVDALVKCIHHHAMPPQWTVLDFVYANTCKLSYLRRWVVAWYTESGDREWYKRGTTRTQLAEKQEFVLDIAMASGRQLTHPKPKSFFQMTREERKAPVDMYSKSDPD